jgi:hypothetical protein
MVAEYLSAAIYQAQSTRKKRRAAEINERGVFSR